MADISHTHEILVVEDDRSIAELVSLVLLDEGYTVRVAPNGREALSAVEQALPDVILLDMNMPVMNGWEFAQQFRERFGRTVPIVVMTAATNARKSAEEIQAEGYVGKPFDISELLSVVDRHVA